MEAERKELLMKAIGATINGNNDEATDALRKAIYAKSRDILGIGGDAPAADTGAADDPNPTDAA